MGCEIASGGPGPARTTTRVEVVEKINHLRKAYHFGPEKIQMYLMGLVGGRPGQVVDVW